jgi:acyl-CoA dehydrogenase
MSELDIFREETREFLEQHCPQSMRNQHFHWEDAHEYYDTDDARTWLQAMAARGWTAPAWPKEYTGGGLDPEHRAILSQEMSRIKALPPSTGNGTQHDWPHASRAWHRGTKTATSAKNR